MPTCTARNPRGPIHSLGFLLVILILMAGADLGLAAAPERERAAESPAPAKANPPLSAMTLTPEKPGSAGGNPAAGEVAPPIPAEARLVLKLPSAFPTSLPGLDVIKDFAEMVETASGGGMEVRLYQPGELVPAKEIHDAVSTGQVNAGFTAAMLLEGRVPAAGLFTSVPFGPSPAVYLAWMQDGGGLKLEQEMLDAEGFNLKVLPLCLLGPESGGWFRGPVEEPEDFRNLKVYWPGLGAKVLAELGADVQLIPGPAIPTALETGELEAADGGQPAVDKALGLWKAAKFNYFPAWHQSATLLELVMNKDVWQGLTPARRAIIETSAQACLALSLARSEAAQGRVVIDNVTQRGVENRIYPPRVLDKLRVATDTVIAREVGTDAWFKKVWDSLEAFRKRHEAWDCLSSQALPRPKCRPVEKPEKK